MNVYRDRLLNVARACRESPKPEAFTMRIFFNSCGTPGCALGHYALRTDLQDAFISLAPGLGWERPWLGDARTLTVVSGPRSPQVMEHFGIIDANWDEAYELFGPCGCANAQTPEEAARYIESFVERKWPLTSGEDYAEYCRWRHEACRVDADGLMNSHGPDGGRARAGKADGMCACGRGYRVGPTYHWRDDEGVCHSRERCA